VTAEVVSTLAVLALTQVALGWYLGYRSFTAYSTFWILCGLAGVTAWRIARRVYPWAGLADAIIRVGVIFFALVVLGGLALGSVGLLGTMPYLCLFVAGGAASLVLNVPGAAGQRSLTGVPILIAATLVPLLAFIVAVGVIQSPLTLYDSLSYHLFFPARWLQDHRIFIIQTPFSDPAQAYQPANGELFFLWLMLPFHSDLVARIGQLPFLLLGATALYALARRSGARPEHALYAPTFYCLARPVVEQAVGADVDLICSAMFVTSLYLGIAALDADERRDWLLWGVSLGLYAGSKYLALIYLPVLLLIPLLRGVRLKALWGLPGILLFALPWYLRNWWVAGSPIYPASLKVAGLTLARGAFTRDAMNNSVFHVTDVRLWPVVAAHAFGAPVLLFWLPCALLGAAMFFARRRWWPGGYILLVPVMMIPLCWFLVPDNADSRFLLPAVTVAMVALTLPFGSGAKWNALVHGVYLVGVAWIVVGTHRQITTPLPWFMGGWLSLEGIVSREALPLFVGFAGIAAGLAYFFSRRPAHALAAMAALCGAGCLTVALGSDAWCAPRRCQVLAISPTYIREAVVVGWRWVDEHVKQSSIAYSGNNLPYPLTGERLSNRVSYVNIDRHADWRFHDYARARTRPASTESSSPLARASGQLVPLGERPGEEASRPRYERRNGYRDAWIQNLRSAGVRHLFISVLSAYEIDYVWHNDRGFPIEDEWAKADPHAFELVYENDQVRIYRLALE
jgi:hypothetical protein